MVVMQVREVAPSQHNAKLARNDWKPCAAARIGTVLVWQLDR